MGMDAHMDCSRLCHGCSSCLLGHVQLPETQTSTTRQPASTSTCIASQKGEKFADSARCSKFADRKTSKGSSCSISHATVD